MEEMSTDFEVFSLLGLNGTYSNYARLARLLQTNNLEVGYFLHLGSAIKPSAVSLFMTQRYNSSDLIFIASDKTLQSMMNAKLFRQRSFTLPWESAHQFQQYTKTNK